MPTPRPSSTCSTCSTRATPGSTPGGAVGLLGADRLLRDLGLDEPTRAEGCRRMRNAFELEFGADADLRRDVGRRVRAEMGGARRASRGGRRRNHPLAPGVQVLDERSTRIAPLAAELAELRAAGRLTSRVETLGTSFVHMWLNRLCRSDARRRSTSPPPRPPVRGPRRPCPVALVTPDDVLLPNGLHDRRRRRGLGGGDRGVQGMGRLGPGSNDPPHRAAGTNLDEESRPPGGGGARHCAAVRPPTALGRRDPGVVRPLGCDRRRLARTRPAPGRGRGGTRPRECGVDRGDHVGHRGTVRMASRPLAHRPRPWRDRMADRRGTRPGHERPRRPRGCLAGPQSGDHRRARRRLDPFRPADTYSWPTRRWPASCAGGRSKSSPPRRGWRSSTPAQRSRTCPTSSVPTSRARPRATSSARSRWTAPGG